MISDNHLNFAKGAFKIVNGLGVTKIVHDIIDEHVAIETTFDYIKVWVATGVISSMISACASDHIDAKTEELVKKTKTFGEKYQEAKNPNP